MTFSEDVRDAAASDSSGQPAWSLYLHQSSPDGFHHQMNFSLSDTEGGYFYAATGNLLTRNPTEWGGWEYTYTGTYSRSSAPTETDDMPRNGSYTAVVVLSRSQTRFVSVTVSMNEGS